LAAGLLSAAPNCWAWSHWLPRQRSVRASPASSPASATGRVRSACRPAPRIGCPGSV